jgi:NTE family protein
MTGPALRAGLLALLALSIAGCNDRARIENVALPMGQANVERRSIISDSPDRPVILMTFSGGGSRAAALAAAVLKDMSQTTYALGSDTFPLTSDVKLISSVSGGSVAAAWFGLHRDAQHPDGDLDELRTSFLSQDNMSELEWAAVDPITWFRLAFTRFTRIEALENLFDKKLFHDAKMQALDQPGKPIVMLNTTDIAGEQAFALSPRRMDDICSSLDDVKLSTGVAASAAYPIVLSPVSFLDYSAGCAGQIRNGDWIQQDLTNPYTVHVNLEEYRDARYSNDLRHGPNPFRVIDYLYFLDGGLADNLGTKSLRSTILERFDGIGLLPAINDGKIRKLVVIVVNAQSDPPNKLYQKNTTPGLVDAINAVTAVPIDSNTANSQISLQQLLVDVADAANAGGAKYSGMKVYGVTVDFDQIPSDTQEHRDLRANVMDIPTSWTLTQQQLQQIDAAAHLLLRSDPCFSALVGDLDIREKPGAIAAVSACDTRVWNAK